MVGLPASVLGRARSAFSNPMGQPVPHLIFDPANSARADFDTVGKPPLRLQLVNKGATEAGDFADLLQAKNPREALRRSGALVHFVAHIVHFLARGIIEVIGAIMALLSIPDQGANESNHSTNGTFLRTAIHWAFERKGLGDDSAPRMILFELSLVLRVDSARRFRDLCRKQILLPTGPLWTTRSRNSIASLLASCRCSE